MNKNRNKEDWNNLEYYQCDICLKTKHKNEINFNLRTNICKECFKKEQFYHPKEIKMDIKQKEALGIFYKYLHKSVEKNFFDPLSSLLTRRVSIDIVKFDDYMVNEYGYDIGKDGSLHKFLTNSFSPELAKAVDNLI